MCTYSRPLHIDGIRTHDFMFEMLSRWSLHQAARAGEKLICVWKSLWLNFEEFYSIGQIKTFSNYYPVLGI
jgi:hypothetical protein